MIPMFMIIVEFICKYIHEHIDENMANKKKKKQY